MSNEMAVKTTDRQEEGRADDEAEPPESERDRRVDVTWDQRQHRYPAQERPPDQADERPRRKRAS